MKNRYIKCFGQDCPFCEAGFPRKITTPVFDFINGTITYWTVNADSEAVKKLYGDQWNPRKEIENES